MTIQTCLFRTAPFYASSSKWFENGRWCLVELWNFSTTQHGWPFPTNPLISMALITAASASSSPTTRYPVPFCSVCLLSRRWRPLSLTMSPPKPKKPSLWKLRRFCAGSARPWLTLCTSYMVQSVYVQSSSTSQFRLCATAPKMLQVMILAMHLGRSGWKERGICRRIHHAHVIRPAPFQFVPVPGLTKNLVLRYVFATTLEYFFHSTVLSGAKELGIHSCSLVPF